MAPDTNAGIWIDGETVAVDDLSFKERRQMRAYALELAGGDDEEMLEDDLLVGMICVVKQRTNPDFTLEQATEVKPKDLVPPADPPTTGAAGTGRQKRSSTSA